MQRKKRGGGLGAKQSGALSSIWLLRLLMIVFLGVSYLPSSSCLPDYVGLKLEHFIMPGNKGLTA